MWTRDCDRSPLLAKPKLEFDLADHENAVFSDIHYFVDCPLSFSIFG